MLILLAIIALIFAMATLRLLLPALQRYRLAAELRRDWWPSFE